MTRGELVVVALRGDYGKPRPALVIQSNHFELHSSVTVLPLTSQILDAPMLRIDLEPAPENGLRGRSQIMIDKAQTVVRARLGRTIGRVDAKVMVEVNRALAVFLGIA